MKSLIFAITLILSVNVYSQSVSENSHVFLRVYDLEGKKIYKGKSYSFSEASLQFIRKGKNVEIPLSEIGFIKTRRSAGHNVLIGAGTGAIMMSVIGAATADPDAWLFGYTAGEGAVMGAVGGGMTGAAIGGISILFKNSESYGINGDIAKWKAFTEMIGGG